MPTIYEIIVTIVALVSIIINVILLILSKREKKAGDLHIDTKVASKDVYSLDFTIPLEDLPNEKSVRLDIHVKK